MIDRWPTPWLSYQFQSTHHQQKNQVSFSGQNIITVYLRKVCLLNLLTHPNWQLMSNLYGMCLILDHLIDTDSDWKSYFQHYRRIMKFCVGKRYVNAAYILYDKEVVDSYLKNPIGGFNSSDSLAIPTHFCSANEHETQNTRSKLGGRLGRAEARNRIQYNPLVQPEDWPEEACFVYNTSYCNGACGKQHVCGKCLIMSANTPTVLISNCLSCITMMILVH